MDADRLNRWLTLAANVGVLIGIALLLVELNQNRDMMRAQIRNEMSSEIVGLLNDVAYSSEFASIYRRGEDGEELDAVEQTQFNFRTYALFRYFENALYQHRQGLYDASEIESQKVTWRRAMASKRVTDLWCVYREGVSEYARSEIDQLLTYGKCD